MTHYFAQPIEPFTCVPVSPHPPPCALVVLVCRLLLFVLVDDDVVLLELHREAEDVRVDLHQLVPQLHLLAETGNHFVAELSQLLCLLLGRLGIASAAAAASAAATARAAQVAAVHNLLFEAADLGLELGDDVLVLGNVVGDVKHVFANLKTQDHGITHDKQLGQSCSFNENVGAHMHYLARNEWELNMQA
jgi:hypothetical protein